MMVHVRMNNGSAEVAMARAMFRRYTWNPLFYDRFKHLFGIGNSWNGLLCQEPTMNSLM